MGMQLDPALMQALQAAMMQQAGGRTAMAGQLGSAMGMGGLGSSLGGMLGAGGGAAEGGAGLAGAAGGLGAMGKLMPILGMASGALSGIGSAIGAGKNRKLQKEQLKIQAHRGVVDSSANNAQLLQALAAALMGRSGRMG